jgi:hypothetical protein
MSSSLPVDVYGGLLHAGNRRKWGRVPDAVRHSGLSRTEIYALIRRRKVESFVYKRHPGAISGCRMVNLESLDAFLDAQAGAAKQEAQ